MTPQSVILILALTAAEIKSIECRVGCVYEGYDGGTYDAKKDTCACIGYVDLEFITNKKFTLRKRTPSE